MGKGLLLVEGSWKLGELTNMLLFKTSLVASIGSAYLMSHSLCALTPGHITLMALGGLSNGPLSTQKLYALLFSSFRHHLKHPFFTEFVCEFPL
jgi:hypothetical protein